MKNDYELNIFSCPNCKSELTFSKNALKCTECGKLYGFENEIPMLLNDAGNLRDFYENSANLYLPTVNEIKKKGDDRFFKVVEELSNVVKDRGQKILDLGCGNAIYFQLFNHPTTYGIDLSIGKLKRAKKFLNSICAGATNLPFKNEMFDVVLCSEVIEHLFEPKKCLNEMFRVLKKGGFAIITFPNTGALQKRLALLFFGRSKGINYHFNKEHIRFFAEKDMKYLLKPYNVKIKKIRGSGFLFFRDWNFVCNIYFPPYNIRKIGGDIFPRFSLGNLFVVQKMA